MRVGLFILAVVVDLRSFAGNLSSTDNSSLQYPSGDVRSCPTQRLDGDGLLRQMEVLPGAGFDNLRNLPMGEVYDYTYSKCMISKDGRFLLPDNVFLVPVQESKLEVFAEVFDHWSAYSSVNSRSINAEASFFSLISGKFSSEHLSMKTHQVSNSAKTTRVQLRHHFYSVKIQPDAQLSSSFKSRILDIAAYLQNNQSDYAEYLAELIVRDYGTHYISSADAGGIVYQLDYISSDYLNDVNVDSRSVTASASFTFLNSLLGNASASFGYRNFVNSSETEKFYRHRRYSEIHTVGGPPIRPGFTIDEWEKGLREKLVAIDRCGDPLQFAITPDSVPELPLPTVRHVATTVYNAINRYYKLNTHYGCTQQGSPNYEFHANIDDGSCQDPTINFTIGGVYQTCLVSPGSNVDLCDPENGGASQINPLTASFSCPAGYRAINLHSGMLSKLTHEWACNKQCEGCGFLWLSRCCKCNKVQKSRVSTATYSAFWCAPSKSMPTSSHGGYLFGGSYTATIVNPITNAMTCPNNYIPLHLGSDIRICVSSDYELGLRHSIPFGGFESCRVGNPLAATNATDQSKWPHQCPSGFSRHLLGINEGCEINYCVRTGVFSNLMNKSPQCPPFRKQPGETGNVSATLLLIGRDGGFWIKNSSARWEKITSGEVAQLQEPTSHVVTDTDNVANSDTGATDINNGLSNGAVAGISVGGTLFLSTTVTVLVFAGVATYNKCKKKQQQSAASDINPLQYVRVEDNI